MIKRFALAVIAVFSAVVVSACTSGNNEPIKDGCLTVAVGADERLYELAEYIAESMGLEAQLIEVDNETALGMLISKKADVAVGYFDSEDSAGLDYTMTMVFDMSCVYAVTVYDSPCTSLADMSELMVGASEDFPKRLSSELDFSQETLYSYSSEKAVQMLGAGELDVFICLEDEAFRLCEENPDLRASVLSDGGTIEYCAVVKRNSSLYGAINSAIGTYITGGKAK